MRSVSKKISYKSYIFCLEIINLYSVLQKQSPLFVKAKGHVVLIFTDRFGKILSGTASALPTAIFQYLFLLKQYLLYLFRSVKIEYF